MTRCLTQEVNFSQTYLLGQLPPRWGIWGVDWLSGTECRRCVLHRNFGRLCRDTWTQHAEIRTCAVLDGYHRQRLKTALCPLTGRQVEHDADWRGVVDDVRPLVQVVHVIAAVGAAIAEHQLQHQILRQSQKGGKKKSQKVIPMATKNVESQLVADVAHWDSIRASSESPERLSGQNMSASSEKNYIRQFFIFCCSDREQAIRSPELHIDPMRMF